MREIENFMDGEEEEPAEVLRNRIQELEKDRGQLAAEAIQGCKHNSILTPVFNEELSTSDSKFSESTKIMMNHTPQKDEVLGRLEKEVSSLKAEVESAEEQRRAEREEAENRERQIREEAEAKVAELKKLFAAANRCRQGLPLMKFAKISDS